jgi:SOS-response transcriptional repressor LexA
MTPRQIKLLDFIRSRIEETGAAPTYAEMVAAIGGTRSNAHLTVGHLIRAGHLKRLDDSKRNLALAAPYRSIVDVPTRVLRAELARREAAI